MDSVQTLLTIKMLLDPRLPSEVKALVPDPFSSDLPLKITEESLNLLSHYTPDLADEYRRANGIILGVNSQLPRAL